MHGALNMPFLIARHVFGTLIGAFRAHQKLDQSGRSAFRVHVTMLDVHPNALALDLCILMLLDSLLDDTTSNTERIEIEATIFYTYLGVVLPGYCFER